MATIETKAAKEGRIGMVPRLEPRPGTVAKKDDAEKKRREQLITDDELKLKMQGENNEPGNDAEEDQALDNQQNPQLNQTPRLVFTEKQELTEEELKELQKNQPNAIFCQALVPLQTIAKQFNLFINSLAQQQGLTYQEFMGKNPGFQCQQNGNVLEITFPDQAQMYNFLEHLNQNNMIKMPDGLQQQISDFRSQQTQTNNAMNPLNTKSTPQQEQRQEEETASASPFNPTPFSTRPTPPMSGDGGD